MPSLAARVPLGGVAVAAMGGALALAVVGLGDPVIAQEGPTPVDVRLRIESAVPDVTSAELTDFVMETLNDGRSWSAAGFRFRVDPAAPYRVVLAEPAEVDRLCRPLQTRSAVSCQNGSAVALNADRWRSGPGSWWTASLDDYRRYMVNHEVGHLVGQRHPTPRCPDKGAPAAVMEQQTKGLEGCTANAWPLWWELERAERRPPVIAPPPEWRPDPVPANLGAATPSTVPTTTAPATSVPAPNAAEVELQAEDQAPPTPDAGGDVAGEDTEPGGDTELVASRSQESGAVIGRRGVWPIWASISVGLLLVAGVAFGVTRFRRSARLRPAPESSAGSEEWEVTVRRGDHVVGRRADTIWIAPPAWDDATTSHFVSTVGTALRSGGDLGTLGSAPGPGEGASVLVRSGGGASVAVLGAAELVVEVAGTRERYVDDAVHLGGRPVDRFGVRVRGGSPGSTSVLLTRRAGAGERPAVAAHRRPGESRDEERVG